MSTNIQNLYENLEKTKISEHSGMIEKLQTEQRFAQLMSGIRNELMEKCVPLAIFNELWGWYCGGTEDGVWQYYEHSIKEELIDDTAGVLRKYGCDEFAEQYINAGKELMPLMAKIPYDDTALINEISERYGNYIDAHANEICMAIKSYLIDNKSEICDVFNDEIILEPEDYSVPAPEGGFDFFDMLSNPYLGEEQRADIAAAFAKFNESDMLSNPYLSEEQRADMAAAFAKINEIADERNGGANIFNIEKRNKE